jgi:hypothetical protein
MTEDKLIKILLLFTLFYFTMHVIMGVLEGRL